MVTSHEALGGTVPRVLRFVNTRLKDVDIGDVDLVLEGVTVSTGDVDGLEEQFRQVLLM